MLTCTTDHYVGRFAPSPSGLLHFGSLICALASYLDARAHDGTWLVRMEDIDPPREQAGAHKAILNSLEMHELHWDGAVRYQSQRSDSYRNALQNLADNGYSYRCNCTRKRLSQLKALQLKANKPSAVYDQHCLYQAPPVGEAAALRLNLGFAMKNLGLQACAANFEDGIQGQQNCDLKELGDFVIHRKDGLFAYNLAVVLDDIDQNVSHIVRGNDLLPCTSAQILLRKVINGCQDNTDKAVSYSHIPLAVDHNGNKLSKQNHAPTIETDKAQNNIYQALTALRLAPPEKSSIADMLAWAQQHWNATALRGVNSIETPIT